MDPAGHEMQELCPANEKVFAEQDPQAAALADEYVPARQSTQVEADVAARAADAFPAGQLWHLVELMVSA